MEKIMEVRVADVIRVCCQVLDQNVQNILQNMLRIEQKDIISLNQYGT